MEQETIQGRHYQYRVAPSADGEAVAFTVPARLGATLTKDAACRLALALLKAAYDTPAA